MTRLIYAICILSLFSCSMPTDSKLTYSNKVVCWGDSLTAGGYTVFLGNLLPEYEVINQGVGGESSSQIMARQSLSNIPYASWSVIFIGQNGGWSSVDELVSQFRSMVNLSSAQNYIVITSHGNSSKELDEKMTREFGSHYLNLWKYMTSDKAIINSGLTITDKDRIDMASGIAPRSLLRDHIHFNNNGNLSLAIAVRDKMKEVSKEIE